MLRARIRAKPKKNAGVGGVGGVEIPTDWNLDATDAADAGVFFILLVSQCENPFPAQWDPKLGIHVT